MVNADVGLEGRLGPMVMPLTASDDWATVRAALPAHRATCPGPRVLPEAADAGAIGIVDLVAGVDTFSMMKGVP